MRKSGRAARLVALSMGVLAVAGGIVATAGAAGASGSGRLVANGIVTEVGGVSTTGTCGVGDSGSFTLTATNNSVTPPKVTVTDVTVTAATTFVEKKVASPSFANVCVGDSAVTIGAESAGVFDASAVAVAKPHVVKPVHFYGKVKAVDGDPITGTCGTAGATGSFTLVTVESGVSFTTTVDVSPTTVFTEPKVTGPTFANLCVGDSALAVGPETGGVVSADVVGIHVPPPPTPIHIGGLVTAVGGVQAAGTCGSAGGSGAFTVTTVDNNTVPPSLVDTTVDVSSSTTFFSHTVADATFADLCVGDKAVAIGPNVSGAIDAASVALRTPKA